MAEAKIISAVGSAGGAGPGLTSKELDEAMAVAIQKALDEGITDPEEIRRRIVQTRDNLVKQHGSP